MPVARKAPMQVSRRKLSRSLPLLAFSRAHLAHLFQTKILGDDDWNFMKYKSCIWFSFFPTEYLSSVWIALQFPILHFICPRRCLVRSTPALRHEALFAFYCWSPIAIAFTILLVIYFQFYLTNKHRAVSSLPPQVVIVGKRLSPAVAWELAVAKQHRGSSQAFADLFPQQHLGQDPPIYDYLLRTFPN